MLGDLIVRVFRKERNRIIGDYLRVQDLSKYQVVAIFKPKNIKDDEWRRVLSLAGLPSEVSRGGA